MHNGSKQAKAGTKLAVWQIRSCHLGLTTATNLFSCQRIHSVSADLPQVFNSGGQTRLFVYADRTTLMRLSSILLALFLGFFAVPARGQGDVRPMYRVFLTDGTVLVSFGEWVRVEDNLVFSMPVTPAAGPSDLHLVSIPVDRIDLDKTERYAD